MCIVTSSLAAKKIRSCVDAFRKLNTLSNQSVSHRQSKVVESPGISFATVSLSSQQRNLLSKEMCPLSIYSHCFLLLLLPHCRFRSHGIIFLAPRVNVGWRRTTPTPTLLLRWRILWSRKVMFSFGPLYRLNFQDLLEGARAHSLVRFWSLFFSFLRNAV